VLLEDQSQLKSSEESFAFIYPDRSMVVRINTGCSVLMTLQAIDKLMYPLAEAKAKQIECNIIYERFDPSLAKYRPEHLALLPLLGQ
jgi:hypothetical protein